MAKAKFLRTPQRVAVAVMTMSASAALAASLVASSDKRDPTEEHAKRNATPKSPQETARRKKRK